MLPERNVILAELGTNAVECQNLSQLLQSAYQCRFDTIELSQTLDKHKDYLSNPLWHKPRDDNTMQTIANSRNQYQLDGVYQPLTLSHQDLNLINKFSERTNLNQKYIVGYLRDARVFIETERQRTQQRHIHLSFATQGNDTPKIREFIKNAYFDARKLRLKVLRELIVVYDRITPKNEDIKMSTDDNVQDRERMAYPNELRKIINTAVEYAFSQNFISNICKSIKGIMGLKDRTFADVYEIEICDSMAIIYAISQRIECDSTDIQSLLDLLLGFIENKQFIHSYRIRACAYILSLSLYQLLDPSSYSPYINPRRESIIGQNSVLNDPDLHLRLNTIMNELSTIGKDKHLQRYAGSFFLLIIAMIYKIQSKESQSPDTAHDKYCGVALRHGALEGLHTDLLESNALLEEFNEMKHTLFVTLADFFCELFDLCDKDMRDYYSREKKALQQQTHSRRNRGLSTMLHVLIYLSHHSRAFCDMFIKHAAGKSFIEFLDNTADLPTPWFPLYAQFIFELARVSPELVYEHLTTEKCEKLTIDAIWQILEKTAQIYMPQKVSKAQLNMSGMNVDGHSGNPYHQISQNQMGGMDMSSTAAEMVWIETPVMNDLEVNIVCAVLKVLESMGCIEAVTTQIDYQHRPPGIIALLFRLLRCSVPTQVMAQTISCVSAFCQQVQGQADNVWKMMERDQVLYTQRQKNQPITKGVELDIIEGEKDGANAIYPVTVSFCKLLRVLLETGDIPKLLGNMSRGQRPPGIHPYTDYIRDIVFLRWSKRQYQSDCEKWQIAATSLQIFEALLNKFDPAKLQPNSNIRALFTQHPSFELLTLLLAPHSNLIEVILDIYQKAFNITESENQYSDDTMEYVRLALVNALNLIKNAIEKEDKFLNICQKYWPQKLSLRPLNTTLLSQQYRQQIISFAKCIEYGNDIVVASHSLAILSHLNRTQQGINLRSVFADQIYILQNAFSTQLYNPQTPNKQSQSDESNPKPLLPDIRVSIVQFLLKSLTVSGHNLGLMLLAFSEQSPARDQLRSQISCLNALLQISIEPEFCLSGSALAESSFELLFRLLSNTRIGERFLNAAESVCSSFFVTLLRQNIAHTSVLPISSEMEDQRNILTCFLNQRAWLLKALSFEFHLAYSFNKSGIFDPQDIAYLGLITDPNTDTTEFALWKILELLDVDIGGSIEIDNTNTIWGIDMEQFKQYNNAKQNGIFVWNVEKMYFALDRAPASQTVHDKHLRLQEISVSAVDHNIRVSLVSALDFSYAAWAELVRCVLGNKIIDYNAINNQLLLKILDNILDRLSTRVYGPMWANVANTLSQVALNIMFFFRHSLGEEFPVQITIVGCTTILEGMMNAILMQKDVRNPRANLYSCLSNYLHYSKFKVPNVLSDVDESKALNLNEKVTTEKDKLNCTNVAMLLSRKDELLDVLFSDAVSKDAYLSSVSSLVLQDLLSEHDNVSLDEFNISPPRIWLSMMLEKSRLLFVLRAVCDLDSHIERALASQRHWYFLYQFESMMDILIAASLYENGTIELIDNNCVSQYLTQLKCLQSRVFWTAYSRQSQHRTRSERDASMNVDGANDANINGNNEAKDNSEMEAISIDDTELSMECSRYLQLLSPCLRLISSMFSVCPKNVRLHYQTLTFFAKHSDIINKLLTLDKCDVFVVLRCVKLIVSIWYQLYCGPLYVRHSQRISDISARDATIIQNIESKIQTFYFLLKKFKTLAFGKSRPSYLDSAMNGDGFGGNAHSYGECVYAQMRGESKESIAREIIRVLLNIFRIKSIGSSHKELNGSLCFECVFEKDLDISHKINDSPPTLRLLCDCLLGIVPVSKQTGQWIQTQNTDLTQIAHNNNANILAKLQYIEPMLSTVSMDVNLQCFLIENMLLLLYFHCEFYLKAFASEFYHKFHSAVMCEVVQSLKTWYEAEETCILHVRQDMIEKRWVNGVHIPHSSKMFIEIMLEKFYILDRDNRTVLSLEQ